MSKISERLFPALYRTLVAKPGQMQLFSARPRWELVVEIARATNPLCKNECWRVGDPNVCICSAILSSTIPTT